MHRIVYKQTTTKVSNYTIKVQLENTDYSNMTIPSNSIQDYITKWNSLPEESRNRFCAISFAMHNSKGMPIVRHCTNLLSILHCVDQWSEEQAKFLKNLFFLENLFLLLHSMLLLSAANFAEPSRESIVALLSGEVTPLAYGIGNSVLHWCLNCLGCGDVFGSTVHLSLESLSQSWIRHIKTVFTAANILIHLRSTNPGVIKSMMGQQIRGTGCPEFTTMWTWFRDSQGNRDLEETQ